MLRARFSSPARHGLVIIAYTLIALGLTYPLVIHFATHVPGDGIDDPALAWNLWWVRHALVDLRTNPFACDWLFYPIGINLAFYTLTVLNGVLSIPLQMTLGLVPASNVLLLSSFVLGGYGAYLLALTVMKERAQAARAPFPRGEQVGAFVAGFIYAFSSSKLFYAALGQFNIASSQWVPFAILYLWRMKREPARLRHPLLAGLFLVLQAWAELTYASFLLIFIALFAFWLLARARRRAALQQTLRNLALLGLVFLAGLSPILANMIPDLRAEGDFFTSGGGFADVFSADLAGYLVPTMHHPFLGNLVRNLRIPYDKGQQLYLGYGVLLLAAAGLWARRQEAGARFWALSVALFFLLTLGPTLRINGHDTGLPLPFALLEQLPFFKGNRYPSRYSVMLTLSLAVLAGAGLAAWLSIGGRRRRVVLLGLCVLVAFEHLSLPLPLSDFRIPSLYRRLAQEEGDFTVLELPLGWRNGARVMGTQDVIIMWVQWYQTAHGKRLLGGNTSRNPEFKFQYFAEAPVLNSLIALETGHAVDAATWGKDRALAPLVMQFLNVRYLVAHTAKLPPVVLAYVESVLPVEQVAVEGDIRLYRVAAPAPALSVERPDSPWGRLALAEGWSLPDAEGVWAQREEVRLLFPVPPEARHLRLRLRAPGPEQWLIPIFNGHHFPYVILTEEWQDYIIDLPPRTHRAGLNELRLWFKRLYQVPEPASPQAIGQTGATLPRNVLVSSAGLEVGDFGHIYVDGVEVSPNRRGYNLVVLEPKGGEILAVGAFDTNAVVTDSARLVDFIASVPTGAVVAGAAADDASYSLTGEAVQALQRLGVQWDGRGHFRWAHAFIGVKGAPIGTVPEAWSETRPAHLFIGIPASRPRLAAALSEFELLPAR